MQNLVVDDEYIIKMHKHIEDCGEKFESHFEKYINLLNKYSEEGMSSGQISDKIKDYIYMLENMKNYMDDISEAISKVLKNYLSEIDKADKYLY